MKKNTQRSCGPAAGTCCGHCGRSARLHHVFRSSTSLVVLAFLTCAVVFDYYRRFSAHTMTESATPSVDQPVVSMVRPTSPSSGSERRRYVYVTDSDGFVRNCVTGRVLGRAPQDLTTELIRAVSNDTEYADTRREVFEKVFHKKIWGLVDRFYKGPVVSGSPLHMTLETMAQLHVVIDQLKMRYGLSHVRLLDIPCGDLLWMSQFLATRDDIDYTGIDIVPDLIDSHRKLFADQPRWRFHVVDIVRDGIGNWSTADGGDGHYDLVLCRRMLQHLMLSDVMAVLSHLSTARTGDIDRPTFLLVSTFAHESSNRELISGDAKRGQPLNLLIPPISLVPPLCLGRDYAHGVVSYIGMWPLPVRRVVGCDGRRPWSIAVQGIPQKLYSCVNWAI